MMKPKKMKILKIRSRVLAPPTKVIEDKKKKLNKAQCRKIFRIEY